MERGKSIFTEDWHCHDHSHNRGSILQDKYDRMIPDSWSDHHNPTNHAPVETDPTGYIHSGCHKHVGERIGHSPTRPDNTFDVSPLVFDMPPKGGSVVDEQSFLGEILDWFLN